VSSVDAGRLAVTASLQRLRGSSFHLRDPETWKVRPPTAERLKVGTSMRPVLADRRVRRLADMGDLRLTSQKVTKIKRALRSKTAQFNDCHGCRSSRETIGYVCQNDQNDSAADLY